MIKYLFTFTSNRYRPSCSREAIALAADDALIVRVGCGW